MKLTILASTLMLAGFAHAAGPNGFDQQLSIAEREFVPLVEAMPADKFSFAPTDGEFKDARTFALQAAHVGAVLYSFSSRILGEKNPSDMGENENGPKSLHTKAEIVKYVKDAFAYAHRAMQSLDAKTATDAQISTAVLNVGHIYDHYGQMVIYARMNRIIPPASRPRSN
jgi:3-phosphoglycerate kinase